MVQIRPGRAAPAVLALSLLSGLMASASAQGTAGGGFAPGARNIIDLNFSGTPVGQFPQGLRQLPGAKLEVVMKDGVHMLRASSPSEFVLPLPEALPKNFTLEIELIPKACCNPVDLAVEGVISGSRSAVSAQLEWDPDHFMIVGGNPETFQMDMPAAIGAALPSTLTVVALSFDDETVKMYTNGQRVYTLSGRKFVRGRVLRISLGGTDADQYAVYLARVRIADATTVVTAAPTAPLASTATNTSASLGGSRTPSGPVTAAGTGTIATTQPTQAVPASTGAVASGPTTGRNPAAAGSVAAFAGPAPRSIALTGFTASGIRINPQTFSLPAYAGIGTLGNAASRQIRLTGFTASGTLAIANSRTIALPGFAAAGNSASVSGSSAVAQRTVTLAGFLGSGIFSPLAPRTVALPAFSAAGLWSLAASRTIRLPAITAIGSPNLVAPRSIKLAGWIASGTSGTP